MTVKTKSIYEPAAAEDGLRVLITRHYPRGVRKDRFDRRVISLSPSRHLLSSYRNGEKDWAQFGKAFLAELRASPDSMEALRTLGELCKAQDVTLLCYERTGLPCHRYIVRDLLTSPGLLSTRVGATARETAKPPTGPRAKDTFLLAKKRGRKAQK